MKRTTIVFFRVEKLHRVELDGGDPTGPMKAL